MSTPANLLHEVLRQQRDVFNPAYLIPGFPRDTARPQSGVFNATNLIAPPASLAVPPLSELGILLQALRAPAKPAAPGAPLQTLLAPVLDDSGSMEHGCDQTITGYNQQLDTLRNNAQEIGCQVLQIVFSTQARVASEFASPQSLVSLSRENYKPMGGTSLYDTVAATVKKLLSHPLAHDDNTSILLTILTDGDDSSSTVWKTNGLKEFRELMKAINQNDRWTVALAGPDIKLRQFADEMSVDRDNVAAFTPSSVASRHSAMISGTQAMSSFVSGRSMGMKKSEMLYAGTAAGAMAASILDGKNIC